MHFLEKLLGYFRLRGSGHSVRTDPKLRDEDFGIVIFRVRLIVLWGTSRVSKPLT